MGRRTPRQVLITGGAGFIGSNLAAHLLERTEDVVHIFDNLSRRGAELNLEWLSRLARGGSRLRVSRADTRDEGAVKQAGREATHIFHFAAQVAVTTSVADPVSDCDTNVRGTLNVLEAARLAGKHARVLFTSTNKVYGALEDVRLEANAERYRFADQYAAGVDESAPLDFHSPYGCSKGAADQYVRDYARIYGLPTTVFRMSCIAGPRQFGNEDQGWVAHFLYAVLAGQPITIYGDGRQVRDVLHVHDLVEAMLAVQETQATAGRIYNVGGGVERAFSVLEVLKQIRELTHRTVKPRYQEARPGDQLIYVTDFRRLHQDTGWLPKRSFGDTLRDIEAFARERKDAVTEQALVEQVA